MTGKTFFEYVSNIFYPWLVENNIEYPIMFYVDGHTSHLTLHLNNFCKEKRIELVALYPNATHLLQRMDVGLFHSLKTAWKHVVHNWQITNSFKKIKRENFTPLLNEVLEISATPQTLSNSFSACGLCPLNPDAVDYSKIKTLSNKTGTTNNNSEHNLGYKLED
jgi:predicted aldo/keto reductase-like oxidoreductase